MAETVNVVPPNSPWNLMPVNPGQDPGQQTYDQIQQRLNAFGGQVAEQQRQQAVANLGYQKSLTEAPVPVDLSSLYGLTDTWTGSKMQAGYKPPESVEKNRDLLARLQDSLNKGQQGLTQDQVNLLKAQLETQARKEDRQLQLETLKEQKSQTRALQAQARGDKLDAKASKELAAAQDRWVKDPIAVEATKKFYEVQGVRDALSEATTNPALKGIVPALIARLNEKGVLTDQDIVRYSGDTSFGARWKQLLQSAEEGTITPENLELFKRVAEGFATTAENTMNERANVHARQYSKISGRTPEDSLSDITGNTLSPDILKPKKPKQAPQEFQPGATHFDKELGKNRVFQGGDVKDVRNWIPEE